MLWTCKSYGWYEQLKIQWAQAARYYELLNVMDDMNDMNDFASWTQASRCYEQLKVVDDMDDSGS